MQKISTFLLGVSKNTYFIDDEGKFSRIRDNNFIFNEEKINIWKDSEDDK